MPCRDDCPTCGQYCCVCNDPHYKKWGHYDFENALCDVLSLVENNAPKTFAKIDPTTLEWWRDHESHEKDRIKAEALAKLTPRERRALGLK